MEGFIRSVLLDKGRNVFVVEPDAPVRRAVRIMNDRGVGSLLVMEPPERAPAGIFTERDVLRRVVDAGRDPETTLVADVMTRDLITIHPDTRIGEAMTLMTEHRARHLPVLDAGEVVGMVSIGDVTRWVSMNQEELLKAYEEYVTGRRAEEPAR